MYFEKKDKSIGLLNILSICIVICLAVSSGILVFLSQLKNVSINYEGRVITTKTMAKTVEDVLKEQKLVYNNTNVYPGLKQSLSTNNSNIINVVKIVKAQPVLQVAVAKVEPKTNTDASVQKNDTKLSLESRNIINSKEIAKKM